MKINFKRGVFRIWISIGILVFAIWAFATADNFFSKTQEEVYLFTQGSGEIGTTFYQAENCGYPFNQNLVTKKYGKYVDIQIFECRNDKKFWLTKESVPVANFDNFYNSIATLEQEAREHAMEGLKSQAFVLAVLSLIWVGIWVFCRFIVNGFAKAE